MQVDLYNGHKVVVVVVVLLESWRKGSNVRPDHCLGSTLCSTERLNTDCSARRGTSGL